MTDIFNIFIVVIAIILVLSSYLISNVIKLVFIIFLLVLISAVILIVILKDKKTNEVKKKKKNEERRADVGIVIGIDLGTTYSRVGVYRNGSLEIIKTFPSYVAFTNEGSKLIGDAAKDQLIINPKNTIFNAYRLMGRQWTDEVVQNSIQEFKFSFDLIEQNGQVSIKIKTAQGEETLAPELICAMLIGEMKTIAARYLGTEVSQITHAIVTVPANFNDAQRRAVKTAVNIAGLSVASLIHAPNAAAIAYNLKKKRSTWTRYTSFYQSSKKKIVLVLDLGGGHLDINLVSIENGKFKELSTNGDTNLGGDDFDQRIVDHFIGIINENTGRDVRQDSKTLQELRIKVEEAKKELSNWPFYKFHKKMEKEIEIFFENYHFLGILTRVMFEKLNDDLFYRIIELADTTLAEVKMNKTHIDEIILVGGSSRIPKIQQLVRVHFGRKPYLSSDYDVLYGTAVQASRFSDEEDTEVINLLNVTPFSLGLQDADGWVREIISKNEAIPLERSTLTGTDEDGKTSVFIDVYEGEKGMINNNRFLGQFELTGIIPAPAGQTEIEVTLKLNSNGILQVSAKETATGNQKILDIVYDLNRRSLEDIENMKQQFRRYD